MPSTWTSKAMWKAVAYVLIIHIISELMTEFLQKNMDDYLPDHLLPFERPAPEPKNTRKFWLYVLPRSILQDLVTSPAEYWWICTLERMLPGRRKPGPSTRTSVQTDNKSIGESYDSREDETLKRLVAEGKVRRLKGLNWFNTFAKLGVDCTLGQLLSEFLELIFISIWRRSIPSSDRIFKKTIGYALMNMLFYFFSFTTFAKLVSFIIVPVQHRLTFVAAMVLVGHVFLVACQPVVLPFVMNLKWTQDTVASARDAYKATKNLTVTGSNVTTLLNDTKIVM